MSESVRTRDMGNHVDIQVGSCIYLSVCLLWSIALHLGSE